MPDGEFLIGALPGVSNVTLTAGFSGHDFNYEHFATLPPDTPFPDWQAG